ncbi:MAG: hypothetical protein NT166_24475 [Candidatus Aminicenantes bacterium]|nr:hypothetical protein [Candidatus Aminicenantes bacterium]
MTKTKTNARERREKHERDHRKVLLLFFVLNFENLDFDIVSNFVLRASCLHDLFSCRPLTILDPYNIIEP